MTYVDRRLGGVDRWYLHRPRELDMRVPDELLKCVVFIGTTEYPDGSSEHAEHTLEGTGFIICLSVPGHTDKFFAFIVTAGHVADRTEGKDCWIRANTKDGGHVPMSAT